MAAQKDTIYVDVDEEITSLVEKVKGSESTIVALVLPKRAVVLQSIVNMKLLKRTADDASKRVVLITSETGLLPLAGAVGVYVAKNLQSKPEIPVAPDSPEAEDELLDEAEEADAADDPEVDPEASVGDLADDDVFEQPGASTAQKTSKAAKAPKRAKAAKAPKDKKNKVPNFEKFRLKVVLGVIGVILLLIAVWYAFFVAPKAEIVLKTETSTSNSSIDFVASTAATEADIDGNVIPSKAVEVEKTESQSAPATGQKDLGTKASGSVTISNCTDNAVTVPAGTGVSSNGLTFITQSTLALDPGEFNSGGVCRSSGDHVGTTKVTAQDNGDKYNLANGATYSVAGFGSSVTGKGTAMSGGSSRIVKVVSQQDIDNATQKITDSSQTVKSDLQKQLEDQGFYALTDTFAVKSESVTASPQLDQEGSEVTVTAKRIYVMNGVKREDLEKLVEASVKDELDERSLQVQDDGIDDAVFRLGDRKGDGSVNISMQVQVALGPKVDEAKFKEDIAGKKKGDVQNIAKEIDGVRDVEVNFSPFWVSTTPKDVNKITIKYEEAQ